MQFIYHAQAGEKELTLTKESHTHLYKSRRTRLCETLSLRNLKDDYLYLYQQTRINRHSATLLLLQSKLFPLLPLHPIHLLLSTIHSKEIYKLLPFLNEIGVAKLTLFHAQFSQKEHLDTNKLHKILINSSQQCGRSNIMHLEILPSLSEVLALYPQIGVFDFGGEPLTPTALPILIGPEGGFSPEERRLIRSLPTYSTGSPLILRSPTACIYIASILANQNP